MIGKSVLWVSLTISGSVIISIVALTGWWFARMPHPPETLANLQALERRGAVSIPASNDASAPASLPSGLSADIVRLMPNGDLVVAGRAEPGARVALLDQGAPLAELKSDPASGEFVFLPPRLAAGEHRLSLRSTAVADSGQTTEIVILAASIPHETVTSNTALPSPSVTAVVPVKIGAVTVGAKTEMATITRGDTLWRISRARLGHGALFTTIYQANSTVIRNPNIIFPGQVVTIP